METNSAQSDDADLVCRMGDAAEAISENTRELVWWTWPVLILGLFELSGPMIGAAVAVLMAVWLIRRYHSPWIVVALVLVPATAQLYGLWIVLRKPTIGGWIDLALVGFVTWQLVEATRAAFHHKRLLTTWERRHPTVGSHISRRVNRGCTVVLPLVCLAWLNGVALAVPADPRGGSERPGVCERQAVKLVGQRAVRVGKGIKAPRKVRDVRPDYPSWPPETTGRGVWVGETLIDTQGLVSHVWTIREPEITPELPAFNRAIVDAIWRWRFEPLVVNGVTVPACVTVAVNPHW